MKKPLAIALALLVLAAPTAWSAPKQDSGGPAHGCDQATENDGDAYDSTCDGSPSQNGKGDGNASGKPCAGCVGAADNKNPKGQEPDGSDHNRGYECDENEGVGQSNPSHTGCIPYSNQALPKQNKKFDGSKVLDFRPELDTTGPTGAMLVVSTALLLLLVYGGSFFARRARTRGPRSDAR